MQPGYGQPMMQPGYGQPMMQPGYGQPMMPGMGMHPPGMMPGMGMPPPGMHPPGMMPGMMQPGMGMGMGMSMGMRPPMVYSQAPMGYPTPFPVYTGAMQAGMYFKPVWSPKRMQKLQKAYYDVTKDGVITPKEMKKVLKKFGYKISPYEAQWILATLDRNRDGRIDFNEFYMGIQQFCMSWPRHRNPSKAAKAHHVANYNWGGHPGFPQHLHHMYQPRMF